MSNLKNSCFVCLMDTDKNMKTVCHNDLEDEIFTQVKYTLPELASLKSDVPVLICLSCNITLGFFYKFKKKCLDNYTKWKNYIVTSEEPSGTQTHSSNELQNRVTNCKQDKNINEEHEDELLSSSETKEDILSDSQIDINDKNSLLKPEPELQIILNIKDDNIDTLPASEELNQEKSLVSEDQEYILQPEFVNVKCELLSDNEEDDSIDNNALDEDNTNSINITDSNELKCIICKEIFSDKTIFENHLRSHIDNFKSVECLFCEKIFAKPNVCRRHMKLHLGIKDFECAICKKKYALQNSLNVHMRIHTSETDVECLICNKKFVNLKEHMRSHSGIKDIECTICNKMFSSKSALKIHLKRHAGVKEFECEICNKKFIEKNYLNEHMKYHFKKFECSICKKKIPNKGAYKIHMDTHAGIRKFECTICKKTFVSNNCLIKHKKYHLGVRKFECTICKKKFITSSNLHVHMTFHSDPKFDCPSCTKKFYTNNDLKKHVSTQHKDTQRTQEESSKS